MLVHTCVTGYASKWRFIYVTGGHPVLRDLPPVEFVYLVLLACYVRVTVGDSDFCLPADIFGSDWRGKNQMVLKN